MHVGAIGASLPRAPPILAILANMQQRHNILPLEEFQARYAWVMDLGAGGFGSVTR